MDLADRLAALWQHSAFRSGIHLTEPERADLRSLGLEAVAERSRPLIAARLGPAQPANDGRQTPWHGFPAFPAQHATATCCRGCLEKWHGIERGRALTAAEVAHAVSAIGRWLETQQTAHATADAQPGRTRRGAGRGLSTQLTIELQDGHGTEG